MQEEQVVNAAEEQAAENAVHSEAENNDGLNVENQGESNVSNEELAALKAELAKTQAELAEAKDQNLRFQADFINFRKRKEKEMAETIAFANEGLIKTMLPILDDFARTLVAIEKTDNLTAIKEGIALVAKNMQHIFNKAGVEPIEAIGQPFHPDFHEAITSISVEEEEKKGLVFDEIEKGFKLKEKVIRFSKVVVAE
ncbi:MAG: nucleotide exchange factor GrpE [Bacteroidia bacterium]